MNPTEMTPSGQDMQPVDAAYAKKVKRSKVLNIIGIVLCILMLPLVIVNLTLTIQSVMTPGTPPSFLGHTPLIVTSGSMAPTFDANDLVIVAQPDDPAALEEGHIICYLSGSVLVTHRIIGTELADDGSKMYITQGDANNTPDTVRVAPAQIIGVYETHIRGIGQFALFMQTPTGMICVVIIPLLVLFAIFYTIDHRKYKQLLKEKEASVSAN